MMGCYANEASAAMGIRVPPSLCGLGMGQTRQRLTSAAGSSLIAVAPGTGPAAPFVAAAGAVLSMFGKIFGFGYNPQKLNDTAITEAVKQALNTLWYNLTGEALNGIHRTAPPGQYGAKGIALFTSSKYPSVPYPAGNPNVDPAQVIQEAQQIIAQGRSNLVRQESAQGYDYNANTMLGLMNQVAAARKQESPLTVLTSGVETLFSGGDTGLMSLLPWIAGGYAVYRFVL